MIDLTKTTSTTGCEFYSGYSSLNPGKKFAGDAENWNLLLPVSGTAFLKMEVGPKIKLVPGTLYLLQPGQQRQFDIRESVFIHWLHFNLDAHLQYKPEWNQIQPGIFSVELNAAEISKLIAVFSEIQTLCTDRIPGWYRLAYCLTQEIILRGNMVNQKNTIPGSAANLLEPLEQNRSVKDAAKQSALSKTAFYQQFQKTFGNSPAAYREQRLMNQAQALLEETTLTVKEIADQLSFVNPAYFSTRFKKHFGMSPKEYRAKFGLKSYLL